MNRREFLRSSSALAAATTFVRSPQLWAQASADYTLQIAPLHLEIAPGKTIKTTAVNGTVPGPLIRVREGAPVAIDVVNHTTVPEIVHWHGLHIPSLADGASEEGSPMIAPRGGVVRSAFTARPAGTRWYHSHIYAGHHLERATFSGEFGFFIIDPASDPARYDQEVLLALHDWDGYIGGAADGFQQVVYKHATINGRMLGFGDPIRVRQGERTLFRVLNASATLTHTLALTGHQFLVTALDGNPVPTPTLRQYAGAGTGGARRCCGADGSAWGLGAGRGRRRDAKIGDGHRRRVRKSIRRAAMESSVGRGFSLRIIRRCDAARGGWRAGSGNSSHLSIEV